MRDFDAELETRLVRYAAIDSQSDEMSATSPSTDIQLAMARLLQAELQDIGAQDVQITPYGAVLATLPATAPGPTIGFLAHVDTAPQFNATGVKPRVIRGYNGGAISYPDNPDLVLTPQASPYLATKIGQDIITASGLTLLGADDKAGVAIIMTAARHLLANRARLHTRKSASPLPRTKRLAVALTSAFPPIWALISPIPLMVARSERLNTKAFPPMGPRSRSPGCPPIPAWHAARWSTR